MLTIPNLLITSWQDKEAKDYRDYIPTDWFFQDGEVKECIHDVIGPKFGRSKAKCDVSVSQNIIEINYEPYIKFNKPNIILGKMQIHFKNTDMSEVSQIKWKDRSKKSYGKTQVTTKFLDDFESEVAEAFRLTSEERQKRLLKIPKNKPPDQVEITTTSYRKNPDVVAETLYQAYQKGGKCQKCGAKPFINSRTGKPYLEVHHIKFLADGGFDTLANSIALCPNCHRKAHYG